MQEKTHYKTVQLTKVLVQKEKVFNLLFLLV